MQLRSFAGELRIVPMDPEGELGKAHDPETRLIPLGMAVAHGDAWEPWVFGTDHGSGTPGPAEDHDSYAILCLFHTLGLQRRNLHVAW
jgi:UDP-glucose 4-epimerase